MGPGFHKQAHPASATSSSVLCWPRGQTLHPFASRHPAEGSSSSLFVSKSRLHLRLFSADRHQAVLRVLLPHQACSARSVALLLELSPTPLFALSCTKTS